MDKKVCDCCGSLVAPGIKVCPTCGNKLYETSKTKEEPLERTQVLPNLGDLDSVFGDEDLDCDLPSALKVDKEPTPMAPPPEKPVVPVDPDLPEVPKEEPAPARRLSVAEEFGLEEILGPRKDEVRELPMHSRKKAAAVSPDVQREKKPEKPRKEERSSEAEMEEPYAHAGATSKVICMILGILVALVGIYIAYRFLRPHLPGANTTKETTSATLPTPTITADKVLTLPVQGEGRFLTVRLEPENKDYQVTYVSADPSIATVTTDGWVTAVSAGKTTVTITCQGVVAVSEIHCDFGSDTTAPSGATEPAKPSESVKPTEPTDSKEPTEPSQPGVKELKLSHSDITLFEKGESARLKAVGLDASQVTWSSDDSSIAEVENGVVTAVGNGVTEIRAQYNGLEASCIVRCQVAQNEPEPNEGSADLTLNYTDVTLQVGETITLHLEDSDGNEVDVSWSQGDSGICQVDGNQITGVASGYTEVTGTYAGQTYTCIIRIP